MITTTTASRTTAVRRIVNATGIAAVAALGLALPAWAAPILDTLTYDYFTAGCDDASPVSEAYLFTTVDRAATLDGDNDVNVGSTVLTSLRADGTDADVNVPSVDTTFAVAGASVLVTSDFVISGRSEVTLATSYSYVIPASNAGTVRTFGVTSIADHLVAECTIPANLGSLSLYINRAPELEPDQAWTYWNTPITVDVLSNDNATWDSGTIDTSSVTLEAALATQDKLPRVPADQIATHVTLATTPAHGTCVVEPDGRITYTPGADFFGTDVCAYGVMDNDGAYADSYLQIDVASAAQIGSIAIWASTPEVEQGGSVQFTATGTTSGGDDVGDVTGDVTFTSDVASDLISGDTVTFPHASPHTITATHTGGATAQMVMEVRVAGDETADPDSSATPDSTQQPSQTGELASTGGPAPAFITLATLLMAGGAGALVAIRLTRS